MFCLERNDKCGFVRRLDSATAGNRSRELHNGVAQHLRRTRSVQRFLAGGLLREDERAARQVPTVGWYSWKGEVSVIRRRLATYATSGTRYGPRAGPRSTFGSVGKDSQPPVSSPRS